MAVPPIRVVAEWVREARTLRRNRVRIKVLCGGGIWFSSLKRKATIRKTYRTAAVPRVTVVVMMVISTAPAAIQLLPLVRRVRYVQVLVVPVGTPSPTSTASRIPIQPQHTGTSAAAATVAPSGEPGRLIGHPVAGIVCIVMVMVVVVVVVVVGSVTAVVAARHSAPSRHGSTVRHPSIVGVHPRDAVELPRRTTGWWWWW